MKANFLLFICYSALFLLPLHAKSQENTYSLKGKIDSLKDGDQLYLVYQVGDQQVTDSSLVKQSQFNFHGTLQYPVYASLFLNRNPYVNRIQPGETLDHIKFYLEPATIQIIAADSLKKSIISGSITDMLNRKLQHKLKLNDEQFSAMNKEYEKLSPEKKNDTAIYQSFIRREQQLLLQSYEIHLDFVNEHPDDYLSVISLSHIAAQPTMTQRAAAAYTRLSPQLKQTTLGQGIVAQLSAVENTRIGHTAPDFVQNKPTGEKVRLSDFRNQYVLLDFWASWCGPCRDENPNVLKAYQQWKDKGFTVLGVSLDGPGQKDAWIKAIADDGLVWPQSSDLMGWENGAAKIYGVRSIPTNFLIDPDGKIIAKNLRAEALLTELEKLFK